MASVLLSRKAPLKFYPYCAAERTDGGASCPWRHLSYLCCGRNNVPFRRWIILSKEGEETLPELAEVLFTGGNAGKWPGFLAGRAK